MIAGYAPGDTMQRVTHGPRRRPWQAGITLLVLLLAGCSGGSSTPKGPLSFSTIARPAKPPASVLVLGPSFMAQTVPALTAALGSSSYISVDDGTYAGLPNQVTASGYDWRSDWYKRLHAKHYAAVIVLDWFVEIPQDNCQGSVAAKQKCHDTGYANWYRATMEDALSVLKTGNTEILWVNLPSLDFVAGPGVDPAITAIYNHDIKTLNRTAKEVAANEPSLAILDIHTLLDSAHGTYAKFLPLPSGGYLQARAVDGTHLCPYGAEKIADASAKLLVPGWQSSRSAAWVNGTWRKDAIFHHNFRGPGLVPCQDTPIDTPPA